MSASAQNATVSPVQVRRAILTQSKRANVGHIGSGLSVVEILCALHGGVLRISRPDDPDRDRFVLSKGHAALALYAVLALKGWIEAAQLDSYCGEDSMLGVHPESVLPGVDFSTGSLGHGLSIAVGSALAARLQGSNRHIYCLISDGECNEGSIWEAAMFAAHHKLSNLTVILDKNGQQAMGWTRDVCCLDNLAERWSAFGWDTVEADGHSVGDLTAALNAPRGERARIVIANTRFGRGVWYMEQGIAITQKHLPQRPVNWHYLPMSEEEFGIAMSGLEEA
jgi:transketolase